MENKSKAIEAFQRYHETASLDADTQIFSLSKWQRTILRFLIELGEPAATSRVRFKLVQGVYEEWFGKNGGIGTTKEMLEKINKLRKKGVKVPSYEGLETELKFLENAGYIFKQDQPGKTAKYYWILNSNFVAHYLKRRRELSMEWSQACEKDAAIKRHPQMPPFTPEDPAAQKRAFLSSYPKPILEFYGMDYEID